MGTENVGAKRFLDFDLAGGVYIVTGGARGLGLCLAEALVEAGGEVHCLDRLDKPEKEFDEAKKRVLPEFGGSLHYAQLDVRDTESLESVIGGIAARRKKLDGMIAAAGVQQITQAVDYKAGDVTGMLDINYTGLFMTATATAREMLKYKCRGSICLIASMSGLIANKGLLTPVYNSSKAAVIQLARSLAMEWSWIREDGSGGIRANSLSPGHIIMPMVQENFEEVPGLREKWEAENLISNASGFMTGANLCRWRAYCMVRGGQ